MAHVYIGGRDGSRWTSGDTGFLGPRVGKMILKVAFTHPEIKMVFTVALCRSKPEDANPVPGVEVPSILNPHCVHN